MLTVACVWVRGHVAYTAKYVERLHAMARRHISRPFEMVCLTDQNPRNMPSGVRPIRILRHAMLKGWWSKVELWKAGRFTERVLYLDLDSLIVGPLDAVIDYPAPFALVPDAGKFKGAEGLAVVKRFNSSVMVWDGANGDVHKLHRDWQPAVARRLWGDQDWIGEQCASAQAMPADWFPRLSTHRGQWPADAKVVLCKVPKNEAAAEMWPWFREAWG